MMEGNDPPSRAFRAIQAAHSLFGEIRPQRERFAKALGLKWTEAIQPDSPDDPENFGVHAVNLVYRQMGYLKSQASGRPPVIKYPREAGAGQAKETAPMGSQGEVPGDEKLAEWAEILINRAVAESGAVDEWRDALDDIGAWGAGCVIIGFDRDVVSPELAQNASRSVEDITAAAAAGEVDAKPGERHIEAATRLREMVMKAADPEDDFGMDSDEVQNFLMRAQSHDAMSVEEARKPLPMPWKGHSIWARRGQVGLDVFWDSTVCRLEDARWMARRIEMTLREFKSSDLFTAKSKKMVKGAGRRGETGFDGADGTDRNDGQIREEDREDIVVVYEIWERHPEMVEGGIRHFVCKECPGEYIERTSQNPYLDPETRRPLIRGFFPIFVSTPIRSPVNDPKRTFGIPAIAPGWPQQLEANTLRTLSLASAKRHSLRTYVMSSALKGKGNEMAKRKLISGKDGQIFMAPHGVKTASEMKGLLVAIDHSGNNTEIERQEQYNQAAFRQVNGIPAAVLAGQGSSDTLGQDEMAMAAGRDQQGDIIGQVERVFARMCEGIRGLLKLYPIEKVAAMLGAEGAMAVEAWKASSLDGDALDVSFGSRAAAQDAVDKKQLMETIALLQGWLDPLGSPMVDLTPYYKELIRAQGLGTLTLVDPQMKQLQQMAQIGQQVLEAIGEDGVGAILNGTPGGDGGQPAGGGKSPVKSSANDPRSPSNANIGVGARRGAHTVNN